MLNFTTYFRDRRNCRRDLIILLSWLVTWGRLSAQAQESFFEPVSTTQGRLAATARAIPNAKFYKFNEAGLRRALANTVKQDERTQTAVTIALPLPNGTTELFALRETQVLSPALAAAHPTFKTYEGEGTLHKEYIIRISLSSLGFDALIWGVDNDAVYFTKAAAESGSPLYQSYYARDARKVGAVNSPTGDHHCATIGTTDKPALFGLNVNGNRLRAATPSTSQFSTGTTIRVFRIAVATTGEWTRNAGNYAESPDDLAKVRTNALAVVMSSVNRVNGIYERELASRFTLVNPDINGPDNIIFDDPATDPYNNTDQEPQLDINQTTIDNRVKTANYDVGHLFGTGGGGVAVSPSLCQADRKAQGYSARGTDTGDPFVVDYFAHELGHQFGMLHTYNVKDQDGACTTRSEQEAYEVASGSTIMSYVGICNEGRNLQQYNDFALPSFHISSITKATAYLASAATDGCGTTSGSGNAIPTVSAGNSYVIPRLTPFTLTATGADADADDAANLSYSWEEFDLAPANGASGYGGTPSGVYDVDNDGTQRPLLRAYSPVKTSQRTFPSPVFILNPQKNDTPGENQPGLFYTDTHPTGAPGTTCPTGQTCLIGERLPTVARTMNFRVSVRDLRGGVADAGMSVSVVNTPGAFRLTSFDNASTVAGNSQQTITWNVVGTDQAPIGCANVAIKLSTNGGVTFSTTLLASTPNDGSEVVVMPNDVTTSTARLRVEAVGNIFFDISNANFTITPSATATAPVATTNADQMTTVGAAFSYTLNAFLGTLPITYSATGLPGGLAFDAATRVIGGTSTTPGTSSVTITGTNSAGQAMTTFAITVSPSTTPTPTGPFAITGVTTVSCMTVSAGERQLTFNPRYAGDNGSPVSFSVVNERLPTTSPGPYTLRLYTDNPTITLSAVQRGTASTFIYNWISMCTGGTVLPPDPPTGPFAITGVTMVSCLPVLGDANRRSLTFTPQYSGTTGEPISFSVVNEKLPTTEPGPYSLNLYRDNPSITLSAQQGATVSTYRYDWLSVCNPAVRVGTGEVGLRLQVRVLGNPVAGNSAELEISGVTGQPVQLDLVDMQGKSVHAQRIEQATAAERVSLPLRAGNGVLLLRVSTPTQSQQVKLLQTN